MGFVFSCNKDDLYGISTSSTLINFERGGGQKKMTFANGDWEIVKIVNQDNNQQIFGDIYLINGNLIQEKPHAQIRQPGQIGCNLA